MATRRIRHLVEKDGARGPRFFWQPSAKLRDAGWRPLRLLEGTPEPHAEGDAITAAEAMNARLDAWRAAGSDPADAAAFQFPERAPAKDDVSAEAPGAKAEKLPHAEPGSLGELIVLYKRSRHWREKLADKTKESYRENLDILWAWGHDHRRAAITPKRCKRLYEAWCDAGKPSRAEHLIVMGRALYKWGISEDLVAGNPFKDVQVTTVKPDRDLLWTPAAIAAFDAAAVKEGWPSIGDAVFINHWLAQRKGDILTLPAPQTDGGAIYVRQSKTGGKVALPISKVPQLAARIREARARSVKAAEAHKLAATTLLVCETTGRPWGEDYFNRRFAEVRDRAAKELPAVPLATDPDRTVPFKALTFQLLRHTGVCLLAESGCDDSLIRAISGHSLASVNQILERYLVRTSKHAEQAFARRVAYEDQVNEESEQ